MRIVSSHDVSTAACPVTSSLSRVLSWLTDYLTAPHPDQGRHGAVCPYVRPALQAGTLYLAEADLAVTEAAVDDVLHECGRAFAALAPGDDPPGRTSALVASFPQVAPGDAARLLGGVLVRVKPAFVAAGLMLGPVYPGNQVPGAHNPRFRPMRGPVPLVAIRHLMESDLPFLDRPGDPADVRARYVSSYLHHVGPRLSLARRRRAEDMLRSLGEVAS
jgi:hypothetical protein